MKNIFVFIYLLIWLSNNNPVFSIVYSSCEDAYFQTGVEGEYQIKYLANGTIGTVQCTFNDFQITAIIKPNTTDETHLTRVNEPTIYVGYSHFSYDDIHELKMLVSNNCEQKYKYSQQYSFHGPDISFWDGSLINMDSAIDGICQCLVRESCDSSGLNTSDCYTEPNGPSDVKYTDYGKLSVKPERLPIKSMKFYDIESEIEHAWFTVDNFVCKKKFYPKVKNLRDENLCKKRNYEIFFDSYSETCTLIYSIAIEFPFKTSIVNLITENKSCQEIEIFSGNNSQDTAIMNECKRNENNKCNYNCKFHFRNIILIANNNKGISVCEISFK